MLKVCCLRRTQAKLDLPPSSIQKVDVTPTETEKSMFTSILDQCKEDFDKMAGKEGNSKKSNILFSAIMKLRRSLRLKTHESVECAESKTESLKVAECRVSLRVL
ncbi:hypothetical protein LB503_008477 [Fusarium chuoi]|nr:hypothetical protein LB503_008477 [Fusarium chuoi]